jgi:hypothetical protein
LKDAFKGISVSDAEAVVEDRRLEAQNRQARATSVAFSPVSSASVTVAPVFKATLIDGIRFPFLSNCPYYSVPQ